MLCGRWRSRRRQESPVPAQVAASVALPPPSALQDGGTKRPRLRALKKMGLTEDEDVRAMLRGSRLCKIRSRTWQKERLYRLQEDGLSVWFQRRIPHPPSQHIFFVQHIEAVREGHQSEGLRRFGGAFAPARCLTVTFKGRRKNLDLVAPTAEEAQRWVRGLAKLRARLDAMSQRERLDQYPAPEGDGAVVGGPGGRRALALGNPRPRGGTALPFRGPQSEPEPPAPCLQPEGGSAAPRGQPAAVLRESTGPCTGDPPRPGGGVKPVSYQSAGGGAQPVAGIS
uniref:phosphoinositide phospholipase C n=1 Tax=Molossus molossus TaxID=27622 RepID=A0A7J8D0U9_MOLMO|nr:hypothetical protein HJG59_014351 [Molossus molossus]